MRSASSNNLLHKKIEHLTIRPVGRPSLKPKVFYESFMYQAQSRNKARRVVAKVEWYYGELFPGIGFIVTNLNWHSKSVVRFYNLRRLALPRKTKHWTSTTLREKLIKIRAKVVRHARYITFQLAEVAVQKPFWIYFAKDWPFATFAGDGISIDKKESWNKNNRIGSSKKARLTWILHWKDANVDQEGKKWETPEQIQWKIFIPTGDSPYQDQFLRILMFIWEISVKNWQRNILSGGLSFCFLFYLILSGGIWFILQLADLLAIKISLFKNN